MKLVNEIRSRKLNFDPKKHIIGNTIIIGSINTIVAISKKWNVIDDDYFDRLIESYRFPENSELNRKDRESYVSELFEPLFTVTKTENKKQFISEIAL